MELSGPDGSDFRAKITHEDLTDASVIAEALGLDDDDYSLEVGNNEGATEITIVPDSETPAA